MHKRWLTSRQSANKMKTNPRHSGNNELNQNTITDYLVEMLKGISTYAHRCGQFSITDSEIDMFVVDTFSSIASSNTLHADALNGLFSRIRKTRERARTLYHWACELYGRKPEFIKGPATMAIPWTSDETIQRALEAQKEQLSKQQELIYWEKVCTQKLSQMANLLTKSGDTPVANEMYAFFHKCLDSLACDLEIKSLVMLKNNIEKEHDLLVNAMFAGDTLTDLPLSAVSVNVSKVFNITPEPPSPTSTAIKNEASV